MCGREGGGVCAGGGEQPQRVSGSGATRTGGLGIRRTRDVWTRTRTETCQHRAAFAAKPDWAVVRLLRFFLNIIVNMDRGAAHNWILGAGIYHWACKVRHTTNFRRLKRRPRTRRAKMKASCSGDCVSHGEQVCQQIK